MPKPPVPPPPPRARLAAIPAIPPPPPPEALRRRAAPPPVPKPRQSPSTKVKVAISVTALQLREEQVKAKVRYFQPHHETNEELDQITEAVVEELRNLKVTDPAPAPRTDYDREIELIASLRTLLEKLFSPSRTGFVKRKIQEVQRRITRLFFNSELYAQLAAEGRQMPEAAWPEQVLYYELKRHEPAVMAELEAIPVTEPDVREAAVERLNGFTRMLCSDFLSRTTPELEKLLRIYSEELTRFFFEELPKGLGEFCWEVIRESRVAAGHRLGYKLTADKFRAFRATFDKKLLERLVFHVQEPITRRAADSPKTFRAATLQFVSDPRIHSEICAVIDDSVFDYLHGEGFLDLPDDWRHHLGRR